MKFNFKKNCIAIINAVISIKTEYKRNVKNYNKIYENNKLIFIYIYAFSKIFFV